jgi:hypothetical protein
MQPMGFPISMNTESWRKSMLAETRPVNAQVLEWTSSAPQKGGVAIIGLLVIEAGAVNAAVTDLAGGAEPHLIR